MPKAFVLTDPLAVSSSLGEWEDDRVKRAAAVLEKIGFTAEVLGPELVTQRIRDSLETQYGSPDPVSDGYASVARARLANAVRGDIIIVTAAANVGVFRGGLAAQNGYFRTGIPVIELWSDHPYRFFSRFVVFSFEYHRTVACYRDDRSWNQDWIVSPPYYDPIQDSSAELKIHDAVADGQAYGHLEYMRRGIPVLAPDWGIWRETVDHGVTGVLYRSEESKIKAEEWAYRLPSRTVREGVAKRFSLEAAAESLGPYLRRIGNA